MKGLPLFPFKGLQVTFYFPVLGHPRSGYCNCNFSLAFDQNTNLPGSPAENRKGSNQILNFCASFTHLKIQQRSLKAGLGFYS